MQLRPADAQVAAGAMMQQSMQTTSTSQSADAYQGTNGGQDTQNSTDAAANAMSSPRTLPLHAKQQGKRAGSRASSPLGKKKHGASRGRVGSKGAVHQGLPDQAEEEEGLQAQQYAAQEQAEIMIMVQPSCPQYTSPAAH